MTKIGLHDIANSTTPESNKNLAASRSIMMPTDEFPVWTGTGKLVFLPRFIKAVER
jgi:hypothetical protein